MPVVDLDVVVECSSGTYVRALARDLGAALGSAGHLTALRRTRVGPFTLAEAVVLPEPGPDVAAPPVEPIAEVAARCFPVVRLSSEQSARRPGGSAAAGRRARRPDGLVRPGRDVPRALPAGPDGARPEAVFVG